MTTVTRTTAESPQRQTRQPEARQTSLFGEEFEAPNWREHWWGMPSFEMGEARPMFRIAVNFYTWDDVVEFASRLGLRVTKQTNSLWFPPDFVARAGEWEFVDEP